MDLKQLREKSVDDIRENFAKLSGEQLLELRALEENDDTRVRKTLIEAIDAQLAELAEAAKPPAVQDPIVSATDAEPAYMAEDYTGALTIDQAQRRAAKWNAVRMKPVTKVSTK